MKRLREWINHPIMSYKLRRIRKKIEKNLREILEGKLENYPEYNVSHIRAYTSGERIPSRHKDASQKLDETLIEMSNLEMELYKRKLYLEKLRRTKYSV